MDTYVPGDASKAERYDAGAVRLDTVLKEMCYSMAGNESQRRVTGRNDRQGQGINRVVLDGKVLGLSDPNGDARHILDLLYYVADGDEQEMKHFYAWALRRTNRILDQRWPWVSGSPRSDRARDAHCYSSQKAEPDRWQHLTVSSANNLFPG